MTQFTSYDQVGVKEDVSDVIVNISPTKTPFLSLLKTEKVTQKHPEWQEDSLADPADNAQVEGFDAVEATLTPTSLRSNYTQILQKTIKVSGSADAASVYGRAKDSAYHMSKAMTEVKRDLERALIGVDQAAVAGDSATARRMASVFQQIDAGNVVTTDADSGTAGNQAGPLTEANYLAALQALYNAGAEASIFMVKPADSLIVADFAKASGRYRTFDGGSAKTLVNVVNLYVSPFGEQRVVLNRFQKVDKAVCYDPSYWRLLVYRNWFRETLAKTGDNIKMMVCGEFSLKHSNFKASAVVANLT